MGRLVASLGLQGTLTGLTKSTEYPRSLRVFPWAPSIGPHILDRGLKYGPLFGRPLFSKWFIVVCQLVHSPNCGPLVWPLNPDFTWP